MFLRRSAIFTKVAVLTRSQCFGLSCFEEIQMGDVDVGGAPAPRRRDSEDSLAEQIQRAAHESFSGNIADVNNLTV